MSAENGKFKAPGDRLVSRHSDSERVDYTPCCFIEFRGEIHHGDKCQACGEIMLWCRGCGSGEGHEYTTCDRCGKEICPDCQADIDDPDCPADFCEDCCNNRVAGEKVESSKNASSATPIHCIVSPHGHLPVRDKGFTWCWYCGTYDSYFEGTPCHQFSDAHAWWRGDPDQASRAAMPHLYRNLDGPLSSTKRKMLGIEESC